MSDLLNKHELPKPFRLSLNCDDGNDCHAQILLNAELGDRIQNALNKMKDHESGIISITIDCETTWHDSQIKPRDNQRIFDANTNLLKSTNDESDAIANDDHVYAVVDDDNSDSDYARIKCDDGLLVHKHGWICAQGRSKHDGSIYQSVEINLRDLNGIINHLKDSEFSFDANNELGPSMGH